MVPNVPMRRLWPGYDLVVEAGVTGGCPPYTAPVPDDQGLVSSVLVAGPAARLKTSRLVMYPECSLPPHGLTTASPAAEISAHQRESLRVKLWPVPRPSSVPA